MLTSSASTTSSTFVRRPDVTQPLPPQEIPPHPYSFPLDPFQMYAFRAIAADENVLVCAKTGSGKTLVGEYQIHHSLQKGKRVFYTTPIKSLSNQKYHDLRMLYPDATVGIMTGDIKFCPHAQIVVMTAEILRNLLYKQGTSTEHLGLTASLTTENLDAVIFDECHYMNDPDRGHVWEETLTRLPRDIHLVLLSATLHQPERIASWLGDTKQVPLHLIETQYRVVPLTHYLLDSEGKMRMVMDEKENYQERVYAEWLRGRSQEEKEYKQHKQRVQEANANGSKGGVEGKVHIHHAIHRLNKAVHSLEEKDLLPALVFVFSRKQCEYYARHMERALIDTADSAAIRHILGFHLHRYMAELEKTPQYHQLVDLLYRGIAFHHSGLLPILKEAVELLFARGYIKLLFCTETFAVGLNMPTKTVLFASLKKYDSDQGLRVVRSDEYFQMAGRAGRRGKDDRGVVLYLPDGEPLTAQEMRSIMKGARPEVTSRMDFHVNFVLKTIHASASASAPLEWMIVIQGTYGYQERLRRERELDGRLERIKQRQEAYPTLEPYWSETMRCRRLEQRIRETVNAERKELQRQLDTLRNRQLGPRWKKTAEDVQQFEALEREAEQVRQEREAMGTPLAPIEQSIAFLAACGYLEIMGQGEHLTQKGILATEINEGHPLLLTEFYLSGHGRTFTDLDWVVFLSAFLEHREEKKEQNSITQDVSSAVCHAMDFLGYTAEQLQEEEARWCGADRTLGWSYTWEWMDVMREWYEGASSAEITEKHAMFEGNFYRSLLKLINLVNEVISMATYCEHVEQVDQLTRISEQLRRSQWMGESLYLRL